MTGTCLLLQLELDPLQTLCFVSLITEVRPGEVVSEAAESTAVSPGGAATPDSRNEWRPLSLHRDAYAPGVDTRTVTAHIGDLHQRRSAKP